MLTHLLAEPDLVSRLADGRSADSVCTHCNECMPTIYSGTRCVLPTAPPDAPDRESIEVRLVLIFDDA